MCYFVRFQYVRTMSYVSLVSHKASSSVGNILGSYLVILGLKLEGITLWVSWPVFPPPRYQRVLPVQPPNVSAGVTFPLPTATLWSDHLA